MQNLKEAMYYEPINDGRVNCLLCPHNCSIAEGKSGICRVRENIGGRLYSRNYGKVAAIAMDPIEKKPLYHYYPGKYILSIGTLGCNFKCSFCQNYHIAQQSSPTKTIEPSYLVSLCRQDDEECIGAAFTYNEPNVWYEYILEAASFIKQKELKNVLVTNGYISEKPLLEILPYIDAMNIDVKAFSEKYYTEICGGSLKHVKNTVELSAANAHIEITTLIVPGLNDSIEEISSMAKWLSEIKPSIPLHLSRFFPQYKMKGTPTPVSTLKSLKKAAEEYLEYVYIGNVQGDTSTYCPNCKALLVNRDGGIFYEHLDDKICSKCGKVIDILGTKEY